MRIDLVAPGKGGSRKVRLTEVMVTGYSFKRLPGAPDRLFEVVTLSYRKICFDVDQSSICWDVAANTKG